jgi:hypothetical protein
MISAESDAYVDLAVGQLWQIRVCSTEAPVLVVIDPAGSTVTPAIEFEAETALGLGHYLASFAPQDPGRYIVAVTTATQGSLIFQSVVSEITMNGDLPTFEDLDDYLGGAGAHSWTDEQLTDALNAESANQRRVCQVPAAYPDDLRQALLRRAARNLAMRRQLTEQPRTDGDFDSPAFVPPGRDAEIRRYEAPWRKIKVG